MHQCDNKKIIKTFVPSIFLERFCILEKGLDMTYYTVFIISAVAPANQIELLPKTAMTISKA